MVYSTVVVEHNKDSSMVVEQVLELVLQLVYNMELALEYNMAVEPVDSSKFEYNNIGSIDVYGTFQLFYVLVKIFYLIFVFNLKKNSLKIFSINIFKFIRKKTKIVQALITKLFLLLV